MDVLSAEDFKNLVKAGKTAEVKSILRNIPPHEQFARLRLVNQDDPESGLRPLHWAASRGHGELASALAAAGAELEATTARLGSTALHYAASKGHAEVARRLLEAGAGVDRRAGAGEGGWTPLMAAAYWGRRAAVEVLLEKGADSSLESTGTHENQFVGSTAADIANNRGHSGIGERLAAALKELRAQKVAALITKHATVMGGAGVKAPADFDSLDPKKWHALKLNMVEEDFVQLRKNLGLEEELPPIPRENRVAFISHVKEESGAEARLLKLMLIEMLEGKFGVAADDIFLDTDHVHKMSVLVEEVKKTENILLLLTKSFLFKPWCLVELHTAINSRSTVVPILVESLSGDKAFSSAMAARLAASGLEERSKGGAPEGGSGGGRSVRVVAPGGGASAVARKGAPPPPPPLPPYTRRALEQAGADLPGIQKSISKLLQMESLPFTLNTFESVQIDQVQSIVERCLPEGVSLEDLTARGEKGGGAAALRAAAGVLEGGSSNNGGAAGGGGGSATPPRSSLNSGVCSLM